MNCFQCSFEGTPLQVSDHYRSSHEEPRCVACGLAVAVCLSSGGCHTWRLGNPHKHAQIGDTGNCYSTCQGCRWERERASANARPA